MKSIDGRSSTEGGGSEPEALELEAPAAGSSPVEPEDLPPVVLALDTAAQALRQGRPGLAVAVRRFTYVFQPLSEPVEENKQSESPSPDGNAEAAKTLEDEARGLWRAAEDACAALETPTVWEARKATDAGGIGKR